MSRTINSDEYRLIWAIRGTGQSHIGFQSCRFYYSRLSQTVAKQTPGFEEVVERLIKRRILKHEGDDLHLIDPDVDLQLKETAPLPCTLYPREQGSFSYQNSKPPIARKRK